MKTRFKSKSQIFDVVVTVLSVVLSVGTMIYGVMNLGISEAWPELILNACYIACVVTMALFFFNRIDSNRFNSLCTIFVGIAVLLRDILFMPPLEIYPIHLICLTLSVTLLVMLTYFFARSDYESYSRGSLYLLFIIDSVIAGLYCFVVFNNPVNDYTTLLMTEFWIRPTIIYGMVACFVSEKEG